jgi:hypothetical protein
MTDMNTQTANPAIERLEIQIQEKREELLSTLAHWNYLQNIVQPRIMFLYENMFGDLEIEIEKKFRTAHELERRQRLISNQMQSGLAITESSLSFIDSVVKKETERAHKIAMQQDTDITFDSAFGTACNSEVADVEVDIPSVYRQIVKKLHPDVSGETENFKKYWDSVQFAYRSKNIEHLQLFQKTLCPVTNEAYTDDTEKELALRKELQELETSLYRELRRVEKLSKQEPFVFEEPLNDSFWVARRKRRLRDRIFQIDREIHFHERMIRNLTGKFYDNTGKRIAFADYRMSRA